MTSRRQGPKRILIFAGRGKVNSLVLDFFLSHEDARDFLIGFKRCLKSNPQKEERQNEFIQRGYDFAFKCRIFCQSFGIDPALLLQAHLQSMPGDEN